MNLKIFCILVIAIHNHLLRKPMKIHIYYVYILTNAHHTVLYTGVTNELERRCFEHRQKKIKGFTRKFNVDKLIYFERFDFIDLAIAREKQIKGYSRMKKVALIDQFNKEWRELCNDGKVEIPRKPLGQ
jgi:putative endonuclease